MARPILNPTRSPAFYLIKTVLLLLIPIAFCFLFIIRRFYTPPDTDNMKYGFQLGWVYVFCVTGTCWMTNIVSFPVVGFFPLVALPLIGTTASRVLADAFMSNTSMINFGFLTVALAIDSSGLRRRITFTILKQSSGSIRWIYTYTFLTTVIAAGWITGSGATLLMVKVVQELLENLKEGVVHGTLGEERKILLKEIIRKQDKIHSGNEKDTNPTGSEGVDQTNTEETVKPSVTEVADEVDVSAAIGEPKENDIPKDTNAATRLTFQEREGLIKTFEMENDELLNELGGELLFAVSVASNIGCLLWPYCSPMGCELFKLKYAIPIHGPTRYGWSEASWFTFTFPLIVINSVIALSYLLWINFASPLFVRRILQIKEKRVCNVTHEEDSLKEIGKRFSSQYEDLPVLNFQEKGIIVIIPILIIALLTRLPVFITGWAEWISHKPDNNNTDVNFDPRVDVGESVSVMAAVLLIFFIPKAGAKFFRCPSGPNDKPQNAGIAAWKHIQSKFPWAILVLIGGSSCIGRFSGITVVGTIAERITTAIPTSREGVLLQIIMIGFTVVVTHCISNCGATITVMLIWAKVMSLYHNKAAVPGDLAVLMMPVITVASLCFAIPTSSIPTAIVYRYREMYKLSPMYFLRMGFPLLLCTLIPTVLYVLMWRPGSLVAFD